MNCRGYKNTYKSALAAGFVLVLAGCCTASQQGANRRPKPLDTMHLALPGGESIELVYLPPGVYRRGSDPHEPDAGVDQQPKHTVTLTRGFWIGRYEVTNKQYRLFRPDHVSYGIGGERGEFNADNQPVVCVSYHDAVAFCRWASEQTGRVVRLPTEAEWEYACRAGTTTQFSFGDDYALLDEYGWYAGNSGGHSHPVGLKKPNPWGLHDIHGNVAEWVSDVFAYYPPGPLVDPTGPAGDGPRFWRECSWSSQPYEARCAQRSERGPAEHKAASLGFRVVCEE